MIEERDFDKILNEGRKSYAEFFDKIDMTSEDNAVAIAEGAVGGDNGDNELVVDKPLKIRKIINIRGENPMPDNYLTLVYAYTVHCADKRKLEGWLCDPEKIGDPDCHVFKKLSPSDEAWAIATIVNGWDGWVQKFPHLSDPKASIHKKNKGVWTAVKGSDPDDRTVALKRGTARYAYKPGWHEDGIKFYEKAVRFFTDIRKEQDFVSVQIRAREMWAKEMERRELGDDGNKKRKYATVNGGVEQEAPLLWDDTPCTFRQYAV